MRLGQRIQPLFAVVKNIAKIASNYQDQWEKDHVAAGPANRFIWHYEPNYPLNKITGKRDIVNYFKQNQKDWAAEGYPNKFDDLLNEPIREPVILVQIHNLAYLWDGNHRIGASIITHRNKIPAYVGIPTKLEV